MPSTTFAAQADTDPQAEPVAQSSATPNQEPQADPQVALIVGERAFATMEDVKTKIVNADAHITDIETENATMRAELESMKSQLATATSLDQVLSTDTQGTTLTREEIQSLVNNQVGTLDADKLSNANRVGCIAQAEAAYGVDYIGKMDTIAKDIGLTMDEVDKMAGSNPRLFAKTFLPAESKVIPQAPSHASTIRTSSLQTTQVVNEIKPVLSLTSKERTAQFIKQLEAL